jgi:hypothetical protein
MARVGRGVEAFPDDAEEGLAEFGIRVELDEFVRPEGEAFLLQVVAVVLDEQLHSRLLLVLHESSRTLLVEVLQDLAGDCGFNLAELLQELPDLRPDCIQSRSLLLPVLL